MARPAGKEEIMDIQEKIRTRHSVRRYLKTPIRGEVKEKLEELVREANEKSGLSIQLVLEDPQCFDTFLAHYGKFENAVNYLALVGPKGMKGLEEKCGYWGEMLVLEAQGLGLRTCWIGGAYSRGKCKAAVQAGEKLVCVIAVGYGAEEGVPHKHKPLAQVCAVKEADMPDWFRTGAEAALLAPTAMNQQRFYLTLRDGEPVITAGFGPYSRIDLGIVKYHFEAVSGHPCR